MDTYVLGDASWLSISERLGEALQVNWLPRHTVQARSGSASDNEPKRLPNLDWPPALFDDEIFCH